MSKLIKLYRKNFRLWWQKPLPTENMHDDREVTFLELFYDLVYVVIIAEVAHYLGHHLTWTGLWESLFMMVFVMWAWLNGMFYHSLHGTNDISMRVFTFAQMLLMGAMTFFITDIFKDGADGFAITFGLFQLLFTVLWFRTGYHDVQHRSASYPFSMLYLISAIAMFVSVGVDAPVNQQIWATVIGLNLLLPLLSYLRPSSRKQAEEASRHSLDSIERFGLITIVALGEVIVSAINGVNELDSFTLRNALIGGLGISIAIGMWWLYFDFISRRVTQKGFWNNQIYTYFHLPMIAGIAATGAILREMILHNDVALDDTTRWLFTGSVGFTVMLIAGIFAIVKQATPTIQNTVRDASKVVFMVGLAILALGLTDLGYLTLLTAIFILMLLPIFYAMTTFIRIREREERTG